MQYAAMFDRIISCFSAINVYVSDGMDNSNVLIHHFAWPETFEWTMSDNFSLFVIMLHQVKNFYQNKTALTHFFQFYIFYAMM